MSHFTPFFPALSIQYQPHRYHGQLRGGPEHGAEIFYRFAGPGHKLMFVQQGKTISFHQGLIVDVQGQPAGAGFYIVTLMAVGGIAEFPYRQAFVYKTVFVGKPGDQFCFYNFRGSMFAEYRGQVLRILRFTLLQYAVIIGIDI